MNKDALFNVENEENYIHYIITFCMSPYTFLPDILSTHAAKRKQKITRERTVVEILREISPLNNEPIDRCEYNICVSLCVRT